MTVNFETIMKRLLNIEGEFSDHPSDSGGKTRWGITKAVARANGYTGKMQDLPIETAMHIYRTQYWDLMRLDDMHYSVAYEMMDIGINMGISRAGRFFQCTLNVFNQKGKWYSDIVEDGIIGPMTIAAMRRYVQKRGGEGIKVLAAALNAVQGSEYIDLAATYEKNEDFVYGWLLQRVADKYDER